MKHGINDELIIGYINNTLSKSDRISFEKEMEKNTYVADRYLFLKNVATATHLKVVANFKEKVKATEDQLEKEKFFAVTGSAASNSTANKSANTAISTTPKKSILKYVIGLFITLFLLALLGLNMMCSDSVIANDAMRDESMKSYATRTAPVSESTDKQVYQNAIQFYERGHLGVSYQILVKIESTSPMYDDAQYAMALINYYQGGYQAAIRITKQLMDENSKVKDKAGWLQVNAMIQRLGYDPQIIDNYLDSNPSTYYLKKAKALESELEAPIRNFVFL